MNETNKQPGRFRQTYQQGKTVVSLVVTLLLPVYLGLIFFRILVMGGAPLWWMILNGLLFVFSLAQAVYVLVAGIFPVIRKKEE